MSFEEQLTNKQYFENLIEHKSSNPVEVLGELFFEEQKQEVYDLSYIRFAQGEVYYHFKDHEAAIYKWENIKNELEPWAKKNMADAYVELGLYPNAESIYTSIVSDSVILNTEIALQLFSLYTKLDNLEKADSMIKKVVSINPDYPTVTKLARSFYEENEDWKSAVELAVSEGKRQESMQWFSVLRSYIDEGYAEKFAPEYFEQPLLSVKNISHPQFGQLLFSLWKHYVNDEQYLAWVKSFNHLFREMELLDQEQWYETNNLFNEVFFSLINGKYYIHEIKPLIPALLDNWSKIAEFSSATLVSSAILAWNDYFPNAIEQTMVEKAEYTISRESHQDDTVEDGLQLLTDILKWGENEPVKLEWEGEPLYIEGQNDVKDFLQSLQEIKQSEKLLVLIKNLLDTLLEKKAEQKGELRETIAWNEEVLSKLNGALNQLDDLQFTKNNVITKAFQSRKNEMRETIQSKVPEILQGCSDLVHEESDFKNLHVKINNEMNQRIQLYLNETAMPLLRVKFKEWYRKAELEFNESKRFMDELSDGLNQLFGDDMLKLQCDFQVLNDWKRDMERMTSYVVFEKENIFLRFTPSQFLLKSAGKLFGGLSQNKGFLVNQYQKAIENEDFTEVAERIANRFLQQLELFERTLERDISMFFDSPLDVLKVAAEKLKKEKEGNEKELLMLNSSPEKFYDPVTLFQIRHRQLEWLNIRHTSTLIDPA
ncbi:tetratricopeptide repeat protein [Robertmurraya sp. Marseille-Q9965]